MGIKRAYATSCLLKRQGNLARRFGTHQGELSTRFRSCAQNAFKGVSVRSTVRAAEAAEEGPVFFVLRLSGAKPVGSITSDSVLFHSRSEISGNNELAAQILIAKLAGPVYLGGAS
ncbi:unnamed protein product [Rangifer tarandus platyrhynchus]|uniref:Uncharacterized protein n=1 Tax=Rangifer tarandus platyrhynchus TaxID=3082113 RepID=A0ABN8XKP7_RANTA|nr:unnamed protein product [Rangifer tarandus platyrhynchus]